MYKSVVFFIIRDIENCLVVVGCKDVKLKLNIIIFFGYVRYCKIKKKTISYFFLRQHFKKALSLNTTWKQPKFFYFLLINCFLYMIRSIERHNSLIDC